MNCVARGGETPLRRSRRREGKREGGGGVAGAGRLRPRGSKGGESGRASGRGLELEVQMFDTTLSRVLIGVPLGF